MTIPGSDPSALDRRVHRQRERRQRSRVTWLRLILIGLGVVIGVGLGLFYTWRVNPAIQTNIAPWQLDPAGQTEWVVAVSMAWAHDGDVVRAANRLNALRWGDQTFQKVADTACTLIQSQYAQTEAGLIAIRSMVALAQGQGKSGCASGLLSALSTPTPVPAASTSIAVPTATIPALTDTPTPLPGPTITLNAPIVPTITAASGDFKVVRTEPYCDSAHQGLLEIYVQQLDSKGIPGIAIRISAPIGSDQVFTGLELERDLGYADFHMQSGETYTLTIAGSGTSSSGLIAAPCTIKGGATSVTSYRIYFRRTTGN